MDTVPLQWPTYGATQILGAVTSKEERTLTVVSRLLPLRCFFTRIAPILDIVTPRALDQIK